MLPLARRSQRLLLALVAGALLTLPGCHLLIVQDLAGYTVIRIEPGPDVEFDAREAFLTARPGTIVEFPEGTWQFTDEVVITTSHIVVRGQGPDRTTLDFGGQLTGGQGFLATGDAFTMEDIRILDTKGDGVRVEGADGVTFRNVHVEWSGEPRMANGAYGLYPVESRNVLVDGCYVFGSSDAGIYVGQSEDIVVRRSRVVGNVAGIEIENSRNADVYLNEATDNTAGILVFDLPGLPNWGCRAHPDPAQDEADCKGTTVFANWVHGNNRANFAAGGTVALVPAGSGMIVLATDTVEVYGNLIHDNQSGGIAVASYLLTQLPFDDPNYDPFPERIHVHGNDMQRNGLAADFSNDLSTAAAILFFGTIGQIPDALIDGIFDGAKLGGDGNLDPSVQICVTDNVAGDPNDPGAPPVPFGSLNEAEPPAPVFEDGDPATGPGDPIPGSFPEATQAENPHACSHTSSPPTVLSEFSAPPVVEDPFTPEEIAERCDTGADASEGVNWDAFAVDCPNLADYRLFQDPLELTEAPNPGGFGYDLTTPLFSDYAIKHRFAFLPPGEGGAPQPAIYDESDPFDFPVGTFIVKHFEFELVRGDPGQGTRKVETRLLVRREAGWKSLPYIWDAAESVATLSIGGGRADIPWLAGVPNAPRYQIPNINQCTRCHETDLGDEPIGPTARSLNRPFGAAGNQLVEWTKQGWLVGAPADPDDAPRLATWDDEARWTLDERARAYLEANCAHCHRPGSAAGGTGFWLEADRPLGPAVGVCKTPNAAGLGAGGRDFVVVPGDPNASITVFRMMSLQPQVKMPEIEKTVAHAEGVQLVSDWIASLPGGCD